MNDDIEQLKAAINEGVLRQARWQICGSPLDFRFDTDPRPIAPDDVVGGFGDAWRDLTRFGGYDYAKGGGASVWFVIGKGCGAICGLDPEQEVALFHCNASTKQFIETFALLNRFLSDGENLPPDIHERLHEIDDSYQHSEWRLLVDSIKGRHGR